MKKILSLITLTYLLQTSILSIGDAFTDEYSGGSSESLTAHEIILGDDEGDLILDIDIEAIHEFSYFKHAFIRQMLSPGISLPMLRRQSLFFHQEGPLEYAALLDMILIFYNDEERRTAFHTIRHFEITDEFSQIFQIPAGFSLPESMAIYDYFGNQEYPWHMIFIAFKIWHYILSNYD